MASVRSVNSACIKLAGLWNSWAHGHCRALVPGLLQQVVPTVNEFAVAAKADMSANCDYWSATYDTCMENVTKLVVCGQHTLHEAFVLNCALETLQLEKDRNITDIPNIDFGAAWWKQYNVSLNDTVDSYFSSMIKAASADSANFSSICSDTMSETLKMSTDDVVALKKMWQQAGVGGFARAKEAWRLQLFSAQSGMPRPGDRAAGGTTVGVWIGCICGVAACTLLSLRARRRRNTDVQPPSCWVGPSPPLTSSSSDAVVSPARHMSAQRLLVPSQTSEVDLEGELDE